MNVPKLEASVVVMKLFGSAAMWSCVVANHTELWHLRKSDKNNKKADFYGLGTVPGRRRMGLVQGATSYRPWPR